MVWWHSSVDNILQLCTCIFSANTKELVVRYEEQRQHFMTSTTVKQFKKLFPASSTSSKLSTGKIPLLLKLQNKWGDSPLSDLTDLVNLFGVPGNHLHLSKADKGCIALLWLTSVTNAKELKAAISDAADSLQSKGVLQVFVEKELELDLSQHDQGIFTLKYSSSCTCSVILYTCLTTNLNAGLFT